MDEMSFMILKIVVSVCAALISAFVIPYLRKLSQNKNLEEILTAVDVAVKAAEQTIKGDGKGAEKKDLAIKQATNWLKNKGIKIDPNQLDALIESAVYALNTKEI